MNRKPRGGVTVFRKYGTLRLRLSRRFFNGRQAELCLGLPDTPENFKIAIAKAQEIQSDVALERFDPSLNKYKIKGLSPNHGAKENSFSVLFGEFYGVKEQLLEKSSLKILRAAAHYLEECPYKRIEQYQELYHWFLRHLPSKESARRNLQQINACLEYHRKNGAIKDNPLGNLPSIQRQRSHEIDPFTEEEMELILRGISRHTNSHYYLPFVRFLFLTGCRTSEAVALTWEKVNKKGGAITFSTAWVEGRFKGTKTGKGRIFPVNASLKAALPTQGDPDRLVFPSVTGKVIDNHNFNQRVWKPTLRIVGVRYRKLYNTRHTFITNCLKRGVSVQQVATWVGNSPRTIWEHYAGLTGEEVPDF